MILARQLQVGGTNLVGCGRLRYFKNFVVGLHHTERGRKAIVSGKAKQAKYRPSAELSLSTSVSYRFPCWKTAAGWVLCPNWFSSGPRCAQFANNFLTHIEFPCNLERSEGQLHRCSRDPPLDRAWSIALRNFRPLRSIYTINTSFSFRTHLFSVIYGQARRFPVAWLRLKVAF